ncbi:MAG: beta-ketoacyl-[acyl-carrier-protein] synthase family protein [bacterium]
MKKVVVTGMGTVSPFGMGVQVLWENISQGRNGIRHITEFPTDGLCCSVGGVLTGFAPEKYLSRQYLSTMDIFEQMGYVAALEAVEDAGLQWDRSNSYHIGIIGGSAIGGMTTAKEEMERFLKSRGELRPGVFAVPKMEIDMLPGWLAILMGVRGANLAVNTACSTGNYALSIGKSLLQQGLLDVVIVVCSDKSVTALSIAGFCRMRALAKMWEPDPTRSIRPFDRNRSGTLFGDGASALVLETEEHAVRRGAKIYGEIAGVGLSDDAYHIAAPEPEGNSLVFAMQSALKNAGVLPDEVEYINAHGTGTPYNDVIETRSIKKVFGEAAYRIPISSTKSMLGHQLGAASATEAIICLKILQEGILPPTINLDEPDPECDLDYIPYHPRQKNISIILSNSFAFGGHNACVVFRKYPS